MGFDVNKVEHILVSNRLGLGEISNKVVVGEKIEEVRRRFKMPVFEPMLVSAFSSVRKIFRRKPYLKFGEKCTRRGACAKSLSKRGHFS